MVGAPRREALRVTTGPLSPSLGDQGVNHVIVVGRPGSRRRAKPRSRAASAKAADRNKTTLTCLLLCVCVCYGPTGRGTRTGH
eukprot:1987284-Prymnesium_polylepis.1